MPFDPKFVTYVWFDALVNYISIPAVHGDPAINAALGNASGQPADRLWPADMHVIGKDILKFHAVYWPIMLKAMGLPQPKQILVHGLWQKDGERLSKSTGNVIDPIAVINEWGLDAFRFYVVRELAIGPDGNWTDAGFAIALSKPNWPMKPRQSAEPLALDAEAVSRRRGAGAVGRTGTRRGARLSWKCARRWRTTSFRRRW